MLEVSVSIFVFVIGLIIGSFLNVVILRYGTGEGIMGRSRCDGCRKIIEWFENIPILSYIWLRGKCLGCKKALSLQYPLVELATGLVFLAVWIHVSANIEHLTANTGIVINLVFPALFYFFVFSILIVVFVYDLYHKIIPDSFSYSLAVLGLLSVLISVSWPLQINDLISLSAGPVLFLPFWALWYFSGGAWMGLGDGKLALAIGWLLGLNQGLAAVLLAFWIGAAVVLAVMLFQKLKDMHLPDDRKPLSMKSEVPFGPFLIIGFVVSFFFDVSYTSFILLF